MAIVDDINDQIISFWEYITGVEFWLAIGKLAFQIVIIILLAMIVVRVGKKIIHGIFQKRKHSLIRITERREETLKKLITNILVYVVYFIAFVMILESLNLPITSLLAGAGVAGLAIGFGAQNLVRDVITGFFIIFEDMFSVGDYIVTANAEGTVEEIGIRTTKIKSWTGELHIIPNGNITQVTNYSIHNGLAVVDVNIPYESDIEKAEKIIEDILIDLPEKYEQIVSHPTILGVQALETSHVVIRVIAETLPVSQWSGARVIRKEIKEGLYKAGIEIPAPRVVLYPRHKHPTFFDIDREENDK